MLVITTEEIPSINTSYMCLVKIGSIAVHFENHIACPVVESSIAMGGKIV